MAAAALGEPVEGHGAQHQVGPRVLDPHVEDVARLQLGADAREVPQPLAEHVEHGRRGVHPDDALDAEPRDCLERGEPRPAADVEEAGVPAVGHRRHEPARAGAVDGDVAVVDLGAPVEALGRERWRRWLH